MTDSRTADLRAADEQLTEAITVVCRARGYLQPDELIIQHVTVVYIDGISLAAQGASRYVCVTRDSGEGPDAAPVHALEGLLRYGVRHMIDRGDDDL